MKDGIKLKGKLATYMRWPFILTILLVAMDVLLYSVSWKAEESVQYLRQCICCSGFCYIFTEDRCSSTN